MNEYKYDLRETLNDIFKCLLYSELLTLLLYLLEAIVVSLIAVPTETMIQIEPIITYLQMGLPALYLFLKLGNDYGIQIKDCFKKIAIRGRELAALCCFDTGIVSMIYIIIMIVFVAGLFLMPSLLELFDNIPQDQVVLPSQIIMAIILAPLFEEIIYRGIILNLLKPHGTKFAILLSSLLFALGHPSIGVVTAFIGGILLSRITLYYDSIVPAMFVHFLHNAILQLTIEVFIVLMCLLPCCFLYFLFKGDYKKYFDIPMIPDAGNCWHSLLTPYKIIFLLLLLVLSFL